MVLTMKEIIEAKSPCPDCGVYACYDHWGGDHLETREDAESRLVYNSLIEGIEALALAHASGGMDISENAYMEGIRLAIRKVNMDTTPLPTIS